MNRTLFNTLEQIIYNHLIDDKKEIEKDIEKGKYIYLWDKKQYEYCLEFYNFYQSLKEMNN